MSTKIKITVTKEILAASACENATNCAFANAVRDIFPEATVCSDIMVPFGTWDIEVPLTAEMQAFIQWFDELGDPKEYAPQFEEMSFELEIPDYVIDKINIESIRPLLENHPTLEIVE